MGKLEFIFILLGMDSVLEVCDNFFRINANVFGRRQDFIFDVITFECIDF